MPLASAPTDAQLPPPPPRGDNQKAEKYIKQTVILINQDKLPVIHTDLNKFDLSSMQDHYRIDLKDYEVEVSHSKQPDSGKDFYVMIFNNTKKVQENSINKIILAYINLSEEQFRSFKSAADNYLERKRKEAEEKRFNEAIKPIDDLLENIT